MCCHKWHPLLVPFQKSPSDILNGLIDPRFPAHLSLFVGEVPGIDSPSFDKNCLRYVDFWFFIS